ncbi:MAG: hydroxyisourate hydrolase [Acidobacteriaceae bacterium]|nr:hydroxyisourate hydrolase [Acidobacteriaceae bacterium]
MSGISTHVLDVSAGRPASGIMVQLFFGGELAGSGITDGNGRIQTLLANPKPGNYCLLFDSGSYYPDGFYPEVRIFFIVRDSSAHYHVPLLLSPFGYTTYRGS